MADREIDAAKMEALLARRTELVVKMQELCSDLTKIDLDIVKACGLTSEPIAGTIGATIAGTIGAAVAGTAMLSKKR